MATCPGCEDDIDEVCYWAAHMVRYDITAEGMNQYDPYVGDQLDAPQETWECPECGHDFGSEDAAVTFLNTEPTVAPVVPPRRPRPENDKTLKEAIVEVLTMKGRIDLKTLTAEILNTGFKTNSKKFGNTVRVQLYRLDDDNLVVQYDDNTFGLKRQ